MNAHPGARASRPHNTGTASPISSTWLDRQRRYDSASVELAAAVFPPGRWIEVGREHSGASVTLYVKAVFKVMNRASRHNFQILTKRPERLAQLAAEVAWGPNIWQGVSVESPEYLWRIAHLVQVPAHIRFLSLEPLLAAIPQLPLEGVHWVIVGGESGPRRRPITPAWVRGIRDQCRSRPVPFFFKQWGGFNSKSGGCLLDGRKWQEWPESTHAQLLETTAC